MGRVVVVNYISIDGVIQSPLSPDEDRDGGFVHGGWVSRYSDETVTAFMQTATVGAAGLLLGRRSYEIFLEAWADVDDAEPAIAAMNRMPKRGLVVVRPPRRVRRRDAGARARGARSRRRVPPPALPRHSRSRKRMFDERGRLARFGLADSVVAPSGVVILTYTRDNSV